MKPSTHNDPLTDRQAAIFNYLFDHVCRHGRQPTVRAMQQHFGMLAVNGMMVHIRALQKKGWIGDAECRTGYPILRQPNGQPFAGLTPIAQSP